MQHRMEPVGFLQAWPTPRAGGRGFPPATFVFKLSQMSARKFYIKKEIIIEKSKITNYSTPLKHTKLNASFICVWFK